MRRFGGGRLLGACLIVMACAPDSRSNVDGHVARGPSAPALHDARFIPADASSPPEDLPGVHEAERYLMGTPWTMTIVGGTRADALAAAERAFGEVARLESLLSEWQPDSEISRVNRAAGVAPVKIGPELAACVDASLAIARWSDGAFDISWAAMRGLWDFSEDARGIPPTHAQVQRRLPLWNYRNIVLDRAAGTLFLKRPGMQLGLGGVGKGYALDRAGDMLRREGFDNYLIFAGGQVLVHGRRGERAWRIGIQHPREPRQFAYVELTDGSLSTSGDYEHAYTYRGRAYHHIIDPKTGFPSMKSSSVTLVGRTALWADAVDTALFIMGPKKAQQRLQDAPGGPFGAAIVDPQMRLFVSPGLRDQLFLTARVSNDHRIGRARAEDAPAARASDALGDGT